MGTLRGGIRLVLCDRPNKIPGMTMSRSAFEAIERAFGLHPATLPTFFLQGGASSSFIEKEPGTDTIGRIRIVAKACQKAEIANYLLSLSHNVATGWTEALICGDGAIFNRPEDARYGRQMEQIVTSLIASPAMWDNPLFLPCVLLENYTERIHIRAGVTENEVTDLENNLGVTYTGRAGLNVDRDRWPYDIDPKESTVDLHSMLPQIFYLSSCCRWVRDYVQFLLALEEEVGANHGLQRHRQGFAELRDTILFFSSMISGMESFFIIVKDRTSLLVNVVFSITSQQDSRLNQLIAKSSKQDSISMTTFTFIAAMFLPGTFVATLFSMSMFDWKADSGASESSDSIDSTQSYVSGKFWLFWAIAVPLTLITMCGWLIWFKYANWKWVKDLNNTHLIAKDPEAPHAPLRKVGERVRGRFLGPPKPRPREVFS